MHSFKRRQRGDLQNSSQPSRLDHQAHKREHSLKAATLELTSGYSMPSLDPSIKVCRESSFLVDSVYDTLADRDSGCMKPANGLFAGQGWPGRRKHLPEECLQET